MKVIGQQNNEGCLKSVSEVYSSQIPLVSSTSMLVATAFSEHKSRGLFHDRK